MSSSSPKRHASSQKGLNSRRSPGNNKELVFHCHCCGRSWKSTSVLPRGSDDSGRRRCYGCGTQVISGSPSNRSKITPTIPGFKGAGKEVHFATPEIPQDPQQMDRLMQPEYSVKAPFNPSLVRTQRGDSPFPEAEGKANILVNTCGQLKGSRMFAKEAISDLPVLFDTGAEASVVAVDKCSSGKELMSVPAQQLRGVTGQEISSVGMCTMPLDLGFSRVLCHQLIAVDLDLPYIILGLDFMQAHGIVLDPKAEAAYLNSPGDCINLSLFQEVAHPTEICDAITVAQLIKSIRRIEVTSNEESEEAKGGEEKCWEILRSFPGLIAPPDYSQPAKHNFQLDIKFVKDEPIVQKPRRFSQQEHILIKDHFRDLLRRGAVVRGSSEYVAPVVLVPKKNGKTRVCVDYSRLNAQTMPLNFPIPLIRDLAFRLKQEHEWYSVLDLNEAYYSLPLTPRAADRAAIICYDGVFKPKRTQFGLRNAPSQFCEMVATMIRGLEEFVFYYLDDFIIYSRS